MASQMRFSFCPSPQLRYQTRCRPLAKPPTLPLKPTRRPLTSQAARLPVPRLARSIMTNGKPPILRIMRRRRSTLPPASLQLQLLSPVLASFPTQRTRRLTALRALIAISRAGVGNRARALTILSQLIRRTSTSAAVKAVQALLAATPLRLGRMVLILPKVAASPAPAAILVAVREMAQRGTPIRMAEKAITERGTGKAPIDHTVDGACRRWRYTSSPTISAVLPLNLYAEFLGPMLHLSDADASCALRRIAQFEHHSICLARCPIDGLVTFAALAERPRAA